MNRRKQIILIVLSVTLLTSCDLIISSFTYKDKTKDLFETLIREDYENALDHFALDHEWAVNTDIEAMKTGLVEFRERIVSNFGTDLNYTFIRSEKTFSTIEEDNTPPYTTVAFIEFYNESEFGVFRVQFDDLSGKILYINTLDVKQPIPSMAVFWLFGFIAICVPVFNIYVIRQIKRSDLNKKGFKYFAVIFFNVPTITFATFDGLTFELLSFQFLIGIGFSLAGYFNSYWAFGIPLGGLYWFWKLNHRVDEEIESETTGEQNQVIDPINQSEKPTA